MKGLLLMRKERQRFYLLPGMGGTSLRRKRKLILGWSIVAGLLASAIMAGIIFLMYGAKH